MKGTTHYTPTETGYAISGSQEIFNRTLYGSHVNDDIPGRFLTFAGDTPEIMGVVSDWTNNAGNVCLYEKRGVLRSGLTITPGRRYPFAYSNDIDQTSRWFHNSEDVLAEFKNGWMEYELSQISSWFPDVKVNIETYPLMDNDGFLVHYKISTNQRVHFTAAFGGVTGALGRFEYRDEPTRHFSAANAEGNTVELGVNRARVTHTSGNNMLIATSFPADFGIGSAKAMADMYPSIFHTSTPENDDDQAVRICAVIEPGKVLDGFIIALHNSDEATLDKWLAMKNPIGHIKEQIYAKQACIDVTTPERTLDLTVAPTVIALDASWHKDSFHHGAYAYHAPFLGWRNWYAPAALGWNDRVTKTMGMWLSHITHGDIADESVSLVTTPIPKGKNKFIRRIHTLKNQVGRLPAYFDENTMEPQYGPYNMQECALDMMLYYIEWSGDLATAEKYYDDFCAMVEWERRTFDPNDVGLYQNVLNTWISDGHNYNAAYCAQATAYNYRANLVLSKIAKRIGRDGEVFEKRAEKIKKALNEKLWLANEGVIAESQDTLVNCLYHPSVELPTVYHVMDSDMIDDFKAYRTLKFTERHIKNIQTSGNGGRLCYSSNWLPRQYSTCGIFPAENAHLALVYFKLGLKEEAKKILDGIADCYFTGKNPGMAAHVQSDRGTSDFGDQDFTDVSSTYLRLVVEGLFGIRINNLDNVLTIAPGFPSEWEHANLSLKDISLNYSRRGNQEIFNIYSDRTEVKRIRIPLRSSGLEAVMLDGKPVPYEIVAAPNCSFLFVETDKVGRFQLRVMHDNGVLPTVAHPESILAGNRISFEVKDGQIAEVLDISEVLENITVVGNKVYATAKNIAGDHTLFIRVTKSEYDTWLAADYDIVNEDVTETPLEEKPFVPVDISEFFNCDMVDVHEQDYVSPRPKTYAMSMFQNGRYSHVVNHYGRFAIYVDDSYLRNSGGMVHSPSGIPFATPAEGANLACVTTYDTFPTSFTAKLDGKAQEIAVMFVASTYCMQSYVENARITVSYADGTKEEVKLIYPLNIDDWLTAALTTEAEIFYFNDFNHATVERIRLDPEKELASITVEAIANEIVLGVAGISISR